MNKNNKKNSSSEEQIKQKKTNSNKLKTYKSLCTQINNNIQQQDHITKDKSTISDYEQAKVSSSRSRLG